MASEATTWTGILLTPIQMNDNPRFTEAIHLTTTRKMYLDERWRAYNHGRGRSWCGMNASQYPPSKVQHSRQKELPWIVVQHQGCLRNAVSKVGNLLAAVRPELSLRLPYDIRGDSC